MRDWVQYVRDNLALDELKKEREAKIIEDLARQLEDFYREGLSRNMTEAEADAYSREQIKDWDCLESDLRRSEQPNLRPRMERWQDNAGQKSTGGIGTMLGDLIMDLQFGLRTMKKSPGFTAVAVLSLALGIGANSTIFSWINTVLLNPFPGVENSGELVVVTRKTQRGVFGSLSYPDFVDYRDRNTTLAGLLVFETSAVNLTADGQSERAWSQLVSANFFDVLGVPPALGRTFLPEESRTPGEAAVVVLGHGFWQRRFGGEESVIGKVIEINRHPCTIVGVAPEGFQGTDIGLEFDLWIPMMMQQQVKGGTSRLDRRGSSWMDPLARLKPGVSIEQAQAELTSISSQLAKEFPESNRDLPVLLFPLWNSPIGAPSIFRAVFLVLSVVVGLVLLIACANVANLLLARATGRRKEIAVRLALGAGRVRLIRQLLTESLMLALAGGALGVLLAHWASWSLMLFVPPIDAPVNPMLGVNTSVVFFTLGVSVFTALLFGLAPALQTTRTDLQLALSDESGRSSGSRRKGWLRNSLVVAQVSLSLILLVSAALFIRSLQNAQTFDPGFNQKGVLLESTDLFLAGYSAGEGRLFFEELQRELTALPGVESATISRRVPLATRGGSSTSIRVEGYQPAEEEDVFTFYYQIGPAFFRTLEIPLVSGREFTEQDKKDAPLVVIINQTMAKRYWKEDDPVGRRIRLGENWVTVIGVAQDHKINSLTEGPKPLMYLAVQQFYRSQMTLFVRTRGEPADMAFAVREKIRAMNPNLPVYRITTLEKAAAAATLQQRLAGNLLSVFGLVALVMASVGIYGVLAYAVSQRTHEIGIRMALGAKRGDILRLVLQQGGLLLGVGTVLGLAGAFALTQLMSGLLFGVDAHDPFIFLTTPLVLIAVALIACYLPARRATKVDPMVALRYE